MVGRWVFQETRGRVTGGQATALADQSKRRSQPGIPLIPCWDPGAHFDAEALFKSPEMPTMAPAKAIPGILKKPSKQPKGRSPEVSKSTARPKPSLKGKTLNAGNTEGLKKRRAPGTDSEEEDNVDGVRPMKKVRQGFAEQHQKAVTPFPDAIKEDANDVPEVEDTHRSTHK
ncbi:hypothetical protein PAXRUDRAFT_170899, partial [Paxillus rubicundulus Ve08.2h10]